ncbi:MAG: hypothetical protein L0Y42_09565, partial [Phycisphaerales bacterium]|nr:hypothetical protein [Phycisphaerales bacterium]
ATPPSTPIRQLDRMTDSIPLRAPDPVSLKAYSVRLGAPFYGTFALSGITKARPWCNYRSQNVKALRRAR